MNHRVSSLFQKLRFPQWTGSQKIWFTAGIVMVIVTVFFSLYAKEQIDRILGLLNEWNTNQRILLLREENYAAKDEMLKELEALEQENTKKKLVPSSEVSTVIAYVESVWEQCDLAAEKLSMGHKQEWATKQSEPTMYRMDSVISGVGAYADVIRFLEEIDNGIYSLSLGEVAISTDANMQEGDVYLNVSFSFLMVTEQNNRSDGRLPEHTENENPFDYGVKQNE